MMVEIRVTDAGKVLASQREWYGRLYDSYETDLPPIGLSYDGLITAGTEITREQRELTKAVCRLREDAFTSDRELASFAAAVYDVVAGRSVELFLAVASGLADVPVAA